MDITYYGSSCFRITERGHKSLLTDPHLSASALDALRLKADLVTLSHAADSAQLAQIRERQYTIQGAGEYEVGQIFVTGIPLHQVDDASQRVLDNVAYLIEYPNGLTLLHFGALRAAPEQSITELLDEVHALMLPIGPAYLSGDHMADLISAIEPRFVIPMRHADLPRAQYPEALDNFLKAMGGGDSEPRDSLRFTPTSLPETTQIVPLRANLPSR